MSQSTPRLRTSSIALCLLAAILVCSPRASAAGVIGVHVCGSYTAGQGGTGSQIGVAHSGSNSAGIFADYECPPSFDVSGMEVLARGSGVPAGRRGYWQIDTPTGLTIVAARTEGAGTISYSVNQGCGVGGGFY